MASGTPDFLDKEEAAGLLADFTMALEVASTDGITLDELSRCINERQYRFEGNKVRMEIYAFSGGVGVTPKQLGRWRSSMVPVLSVLIAFKVMFLASATGENGPLMVGPTR